MLLDVETVLCNGVVTEFVAIDLVCVVENQHCVALTSHVPAALQNLETAFAASRHTSQVTQTLPLLLIAAAVTARLIELLSDEDLLGQQLH